MDAQQKRMNGVFGTANGGFAKRPATANKAFAQENALFDDLELTGKRIKSMRDRLGMTIREWAAQAGIGVASQYEIEQGTCPNQQMVLFSLQVVPKMLPVAHDKLKEVMATYFSERVA